MESYLWAKPTSLQKRSENPHCIEDTVANYTATIDESITNTYKPGKTSLTVTKKWDDETTAFVRRQSRFNSMPVVKIR